MASKMYLIAVDCTGLGLNEAGLKRYISTSPDFESWWHHIPFVYLVASDLEADTIAERARQFTGDAKLLVIETNPAESQGWLPERSWNWIRKRAGNASGTLQRA